MGSDGNGQTWALRPDVVATVLDHGALLLDLDSKYFYLLNPTGWSLVSLFEVGATDDHALARCHAWGAPGSDEAAIRTAIDSLRDAALIEPVDPVAPVDGSAPTRWQPITIERQAQPLQRVITSAFDPSIPLAE
ncbi:MAG: hypothetical protein ACJ779_07725 [Chloroflexota bacterium]